VPVSHLDLFRLEGLEDEDPGLLADYLTEDAVAFVEWPGIAEPAVPRIAARVEIRHAGGDEREIIISG
jgi:tRNA threonylcarbamoyladenosine biosynthesis protein TsaE